MSNSDRHEHKARCEKAELIIDFVDKEDRIKGTVFGKEIHEGLFHIDISAGILAGLSYL